MAAGDCLCQAALRCPPAAMAVFRMVSSNLDLRQKQVAAPSRLSCTVAESFMQCIFTLAMHTRSKPRTKAKVNYSHLGPSTLPDMQDGRRFICSWSGLFALVAALKEYEDTSKEGPLQHGCSSWDWLLASLSCSKVQEGKHMLKHLTLHMLLSRYFKQRGLVLIPISS